MDPLTIFPFKNMKIIAKLVSNDEGTMGRIQTATGMCVFDSTEVSNMLAYLTSFGIVHQTEAGWSITANDLPFEKGMFREIFLEDAVTLLTSLTNTPKTPEQLSKETKLSLDRVGTYLPFLAEITQYGLIVQNPENFGGLWELASS